MIAFTNGGIGDCFSAIAGVQGAYRAYAAPDEPLYLANAHPGVEWLFPESYHVTRAWALPGDSMQRVVHVELGSQMHHDLYASALAFISVGLEPPSLCPFPELAVWGNSRRAVYDYLIHPWSPDATRGLSVEETRKLIYTIRADEPDARIALIGWDTHAIYKDPKPFHGIFYEYNRPYLEVIAMMKDAKAVITIDSCINRLAYCAAIPNHVLLVDGPCKRIHTAWPGAHVIFGRDAWTQSTPFIKALDNARNALTSK